MSSHTNATCITERRGLCFCRPHKWTVNARACQILANILLSLKACVPQNTLPALDSVPHHAWQSESHNVPCYSQLAPHDRLPTHFLLCAIATETVRATT